MRSPFAHALLVVLAVALLAGAWSGRDEHRAPAAPDAPRARRAPAASSSFAFASPPAYAPLPYATYAVSDGGAPLPYDAGPPEPEPPATGRLARELTSRLCPRVARVVCDARDRFGCGELEPFVDDQGEQIVTTCLQAAQDQCGDWVERHYGWVADDLVVEGGRLDRCVATFARNTSDGESVLLDVAPCTDLASDPAREGERCRASWFPCGTAGDCVDGLCIARAGVGEPCDEVGCAGELACVAGLCEAPVARGGACDEESVCERAGDYCLDGACAPGLALGARCGYDNECVVGSRCVQGRCAPASRDACTLDEACGRGRVCVGPYAARCEAIPDEGSACATESDCRPFLVCEDARCRRTPLPTFGALGEGETCVPSDPTIACRRDLICAFADGNDDCQAPPYVCRRAPGVGEPCENGLCVADAMCVWRVESGHCEATLCNVQQFFPDHGEE